MLKIWPSTDAQLTPKASDRASVNPFETSLANLGPSNLSTSTNGPRTPTVTHHHLLRSDHHDSTPLATPTLGLPSAAPTTQLSLDPPKFSLKMAAPPLRRNHSHTPSIKEKDTQVGGNPSRGQLHVKLIAARGLNVSSPRARPYVVVQFEQSEFVSRNPIDESDAPLRGAPAALSRVNSALNVTAAAGPTSGISRVLASATPRSSVSSGSSNGGQNGNGLLTPNPARLGNTLTAHNPVWKHEVAL
ncbi:hypothetical protein FRC12_023230 [Ceratobasidium sp. 428]|nr:hypothetical protein FRC12_023230 [Ceratobasidium sp. 428]